MAAGSDGQSSRAFLSLLHPLGDRGTMVTVREDHKVLLKRTLSSKAIAIDSDGAWPYSYSKWDVRDV